MPTRTWTARGSNARGGIAIRGARLGRRRSSKAVREAASRTPAGEWIVTDAHAARARARHAALRQPSRASSPKAASPTGATSTPPRPIIRSSSASIWGWWGVPPFPSVANSAALALARTSTGTPGAPHGSRDRARRRGRAHRGDARDQPRADPRIHPVRPPCRASPSRTASAAARTAPRALQRRRHHGGLRGARPHPRHRRELPPGGPGGRSHGPARRHPQRPQRASWTTAEVGDYLRGWADRIAAPGHREGNLATDGICLDFGDPNVARIIGDGLPLRAVGRAFLPVRRFRPAGRDRDPRRRSSASGSPASPTTSRRCCGPTKR